MLVFRDAPGVPIDASAFCAELGRQARTLAAAARPSHDGTVAILVDAGMLETAVADASGGAAPGSPATMLARAATLAAGRAVAASWSSEAAGAREEIAAAAAALDRMTPHLPAETLWLRTPEGYAYYGLYPEMYIEAARRVWRERRPRSALSVGIRSIGASVSAVAAAEIERHGCAIASWTVRPTGHPYAREVRLDGRMRETVTPPPDLAIVADEGPGLSGSSLAATVEALARAGVPRDRIVMLPAHDPDPSRLLSSHAAEVWRRYDRAVASFESTWLESGRLAAAIGLTPCADLSAGRWRARFRCRDDDPAVQPQHERRKYLARDDDGGTYLLKFAGLGRFGQALAARSARLRGTAAAEADIRLAGGFLARRVVEGQPMTSARVDAAFIRAAAAYLGEVARRFPTARAADEDLLARMLETNACELFPRDRLPRLRIILRQARFSAGQGAVELDARMLPHEWIRAADGPLEHVKVDALEHHDDHFYPGPHDIAWDVAGTIVEFDLQAAARDAFLEQIECGVGPVRDRLEFFVASYLAFRAGYCAMGAQALGDCEDGRGLDSAGASYRARLAALLKVSDLRPVAT